MPAKDWKAFVDGLADLDDQARARIKQFVQEALRSSNVFLKRQANKLVLYIEQLAAGKISKEDFKGYVEDIRLLTEMEAAYVSLRAKRKLVDFAFNVSLLILRALIASL